MDVGRTEGVSGPGGIERRKIDAARIRKAESAPPPSDKVEISEGGRLLSEALSLPPTRSEKIEEVRRLIESGKYDTRERLEGAIDRLLQDHPELLGG